MKRVGPAVLFFVFICWAIVQADQGQDNVFFDAVRTLPYGDKLGHALLFGVLAFLINHALHGRSVRVVRWDIQLGALLVLLFALGEELTQLYFPHRTFDLTDLLADVIGVFGFTLLYLTYYQHGERKSEAKAKARR